MTSSPTPARYKILLAFSMIYFVWGSTYLAIRVGVLQMPPFIMAGLRFTIAGLALWIWMRARGTPAMTRREWRDAAMLGSLMFLLDYACLFWAEQRVPSGIAALIIAVIPVMITVLEIVMLHTLRLTLQLAIGLAVGVLGVAVLMNPRASLGEAPLDRGGAIALLVASLGWSIGTILSRRLALPASKAMAAASQMLIGGLLLLVLAAVSGEYAHFEPRRISPGAWFALAYLIVAGSIVAYTAYLWLLHYESPTKVGTYAYVNPIVAVIVGAFLGGESVGRRTILGAALILVSVLAITTIKSKSLRTAPAAKRVEETAAD